MHSDFPNTLYSVQNLVPFYLVHKCHKNCLLLRWWATASRPMEWVLAVCYPLFANLFMAGFDERALEQTTHRPLCWFCYVGHTFVILSYSCIIANHCNIHPHISDHEDELIEIWYLPIFHHILFLSLWCPIGCEHGAHAGVWPFRRTIQYNTIQYKTHPSC
jgi:hypothetical protein